MIQAAKYCSHCPQVNNRGLSSILTLRTRVFQFFSSDTDISDQNVSKDALSLGVGDVILQEKGKSPPCCLTPKTQEFKYRKVKVKAVLRQIAVHPRTESYSLHILLDLYNSEYFGAHLIILQIFKGIYNFKKHAYNLKSILKYSKNVLPTFINLISSS